MQVCSLLFQSTHITTVFAQIFFFFQKKASEVNFVLKGKKKKKGNEVIWLLASQPQNQAHPIQKHINLRENTQHNFKNSQWKTTSTEELKFPNTNHAKSKWTALLETSITII